MNSSIELIFLGTGTSHGVPVIGCDCPVCRSDDPRNKRTRSSALVRIHPDGSADGACTNILIDTAVDFRQQMLRERIDRIDAILYTHHHADHIMGLDDVRAFSDRQGRIDCYAPSFSEDRIRNVFSYAFTAPSHNNWGGLPQLNLHAIDGPLEIAGRRIVPIKVPHGPVISVYGYRIGPLAYVTDCSAIPDEAMELLRDLDVLVLDALRYTPHPTHFSVSEAIDAARCINARQTWFTHICHKIDHATLAAELPPGIQPAYDGLSVRVETRKNDEGMKR